MVLTCEQRSIFLNDRREVGKKGDNRMARKIAKSKVASVAAEVKTEKTEPKTIAVAPMMRREHRTFSHVMYFLFLISATIGLYFTLQSFTVLKQIDNPGYFFPISSIMMLLWAFLFWEFGHRIHN